MGKRMEAVDPSVEAVGDTETENPRNLGSSGADPGKESLNQRIRTDSIQFLRVWGSLRG